MIEPSGPEHRRDRLWGLAASLLLALAFTVAILSQSVFDTGAVVLLSRVTYGVMVGGLVALVLLFVFYVTLRHRELATREVEVHRLAVREATFRGRMSELVSLLETSSHLAQKLDLLGMLNLAASRMLPCLEADHSTIHLYNPREEVLEVVTSVGKKAADAVATPIRPGQGVVGYVFATGEALVVNPGEMSRHLVGELGLPCAPCSALCVPIRFANASLGVFSIVRVDVDEAFVPLHTRALQALAGHCGAAIVKDFHHRRIAREAGRAA